MKYLKELCHYIGIPGLMISFSKTDYMMTHPNNDVLFSANIIIDGEKVWYGDIDLTLDGKNIQNLSNHNSKTILVLKEKDARFENENLTEREYYNKAYKIFNPEV